MMHLFGLVDTVTQKFPTWVKFDDFFLLFNISGTRNSSNFPDWGIFAYLFQWQQKNGGKNQKTMNLDTNPIILTSVKFLNDEP